MLEKASKFSVDHLRENLVNYPTQDDISKCLQKIKKIDSSVSDQLSEFSTLIDQAKTDLFKDLELRTECAFREVKKHVIEALGGKPVDARELQDLLRAKADKSELYILDKMKADREDTSRFEDTVRFAISQMEHILVLTIANLKADLPSANGTEHSRVNKKASLLNQMISLYNWSKKGGDLEGEDDVKDSYQDFKSKKETVLSSLNFRFSFNVSLFSNYRCSKYETQV